MDFVQRVLDATTQMPVQGYVLLCPNIRISPGPALPGKILKNNPHKVTLRSIIYEHVSPAFAF
jgi:hypothetical protein